MKWCLALLVPRPPTVIAGQGFTTGVIETSPAAMGAAGDGGVSGTLGRFAGGGTGRLVTDAGAGVEDPFAR